MPHPFTRVMPPASSGASSPLSAASTASVRTAVMRTLNGNSAEPASLECDAPRARRGLREAGAWLLGTPREEFIQTEVIDTFRNRTRDRVEHKGLQAAPQADIVR